MENDYGDYGEWFKVLVRMIFPHGGVCGVGETMATHPDEMKAPINLKLNLEEQISRAKS